MRKIREYSLNIGLAWAITAFGVYLMQVDYHLDIVSTLPIVFLFYRNGFNALPASLFYGAGNGLLVANATNKDVMTTILYYVIVAALLSVNALFAKNIHRTLNNRRMQSVALNVVTATLIIAIAICGLDFVFTQKLSNVNAVYYTIFTILFVMLFAYMKPKWILTKRSPFLTSKERSKLLND